MVNKKYLVLTLVLFLSASCAAKQSPAGNLNNTASGGYVTPLDVGSQKLLVEIARDEQSMGRGLSGREALQDNQGMLFDFGPDAGTTPAFWMKDMKFNLDLVWIYKNKIIGITPDVPAPNKNMTEKQLPFYYPPSPADKVLEVNAGWNKAHGITVGDNVLLK